MHRPKAVACATKSYLTDGSDEIPYRTTGARSPADVLSGIGYRLTTRLCGNVGVALYY